MSSLLPSRLLNPFYAITSAGDEASAPYLERDGLWATTRGLDDVHGVARDAAITWLGSRNCEDDYQILDMSIPTLLMSSILQTNGLCSGLR
jgi:hypothetical protein